MRWEGVKKNGNGRKVIYVFLIIFLLGLILPKSAKAENTGTSPKNNFYITAISNTLAAINPKGSANKDASITKHPILSFLGVDISNPISIITKQIAYLNKNGISPNSDQGSNEGENIRGVNSFVLDENQISNSVDNTKIIANLFNPALKQILNKSKPRVLIYHSHTTEAFRTSDKDKSTNNFNADETTNVVSVGDVITAELENKYGISVIHDKTVNNVPDYNSAYHNSGVVLDKYLKKYGNFDLIIDLHRDGVPSSTNVLTTKLNGEDVAKYLFTVTRQNPRYAKQKKLVDQMIGISNKLYPGLIDPKQIYYHDFGINFYNQGKSDNAILIEVGNNNNTINQVNNTGMYLSRIIAEQLNGKK